jgi:uncharacterized repeat protein (TIGR02543 family)
MRIFAKNIAFLILSIAIIGCGDNLKPNGTASNTVAVTYTVTFDSQFSDTGSTTTMPSPTSITVNSGETVGTLPSEPTMSGGYKFDGWWTGKGRTGVQFTTGTQVTSDMIVYAYWYKYKITFISDGTTVVIKEITTSTVETLPTSPTKTDNTFAGWWTAEKGGGTQFFANTNVTSMVDSTTKSLTVYANWIANPAEYIVTYNSGWGSTVETKHVISPATNVGALPADPTKQCYTFKEWNTKSDGTGDKFTETTAVTKNTTVYAQWTYVGFTPSYPAPSAYTIGGPGESCVGKVFYIEAGSNNKHGLEMAPPGWSDPYAENGDPSAAWIYGGTTDDGNGGTYQKAQTTLNGNTSTGIGTYSAPTGFTNSEAIIAQVAGLGGTTTPYAAKLCRDYHGGGLDKWFLPSKDELAQLYAQKDVKRWGGFVEERYWSSSEYDANDGWSQYFTTGAQHGTYKSNELLVRPVRAF